MIRFALVVWIAGCGRIGFPDAVDATGAPIGHDEDGDGVPDAIDVCPCLAGSQLDSDGDGVGDDCDPEPTIPRQRLALFATMTPGDQPFQFTGVDAWTQMADSMHYAGNAYGEFTYDIALGNAQIAMGFDVEEMVNPGSQHQLALAITFDPAMPHYFVELNQVDSISLASVTQFDGANYASAANQQLSMGIHAGRVLLQATAIMTFPQPRIRGLIGSRST